LRSVTVAELFSRIEKSLPSQMTAGFFVFVIPGRREATSPE
jgi:hypothetical protein